MYLALGLVLLVVGVEMAAAAGFGRGNIELLVEEVAARHKTSERVIRTAFELALLLVGFALGGQVGIGTFVLALGSVNQQALPSHCRFRSGRAARLTKPAVAGETRLKRSNLKM